MEAKGMMEELSDVSMINRALKVICRELGVERDRKLVLQIATLLVRLVKEGHSLDTDHLISIAKSHLSDITGTSTSEHPASS
ncbi:hypothetical protein [Rhizobium sp. AN80A]|jgi:hypothetical protein|uniref:hypothetical protein n=1 Tax=Rhizobium sp. AN80A TaxID=3040673 RepID=UPI0024B39FE0|nr:hypothetical protein [Rhizobium sp. AN80A]